MSASSRLVIDLHTHTTLSDGTATPGELVAAALREGVDVIGLTDHDTAEGWGEAAAAAARAGIGLVRGTEFSTRHRGASVHLLSYLHAADHPRLASMAEYVRRGRLERARKMADLLAADFPITWDDVLAEASPATTIGRPHLADALVAAGVVPTRGEAFTRILASGSPYYIPHSQIPTLEAIAAIREAGGVPVLAHPGAKRGGRVDDDAIRLFASAGMAGLEVAHRDNDASDQARLGALAAELGLLQTGGSDYHGAGKPNRLGENLTTPEALEAIAAEATGIPIL